MINLPFGLSNKILKYLNRENELMTYSQTSMGARCELLGKFGYNLNKDSSRRFATDLEFRKEVESRGRVHSFKIYGLSIENLDFLPPTVFQVNLYCCNSLLDISALASVHTVVLYNCNRIQDFSALSSVDTLSIIDCAYLTDVSALRNVRNLELKCLIGLRDVSALSTVHTLTLSYIHQVRDVTALVTVQNLTLEGIFLTNEDITTLSAEVPKLYIKNIRFIGEEEFDL
jgi:hypothetical protein